MKNGKKHQKKEVSLIVSQLFDLLKHETRLSTILWDDICLLLLSLEERNLWNDFFLPKNDFSEVLEG